MPFGLTNAPAVFQHFINDILFPVLDKYAFAYIYDILIFSNTFEDHISHVKNVLKLLIQNNLYCKITKCEFFKSSLELLGYIISDKGISMCNDKVSVILNWPIPKSVNELQQFLGLSNFYRRFIKNFADVAKPLHNLTKKNTPFVWTTTHNKAFNTLKNQFCSAPTLAVPDPSGPFIVETDASKFAIGAVLSQKDCNNIYHPCAFISKGLKDAETRYTVYDSELLAIIFALKEWRNYLIGTKEPFDIYTDHNSLRFPKKPQELSDRQERWLEFLSKFNYRIVYKKRTDNKKADILSKRPDLRVSAITSTIQSTESLDSLKNSYEEDEEVNDIINNIKAGKNKDSKFNLFNDYLYYKDKLYETEPYRDKILDRFHSHPAAGHFGYHKTFDLITRYFYWPNLREDIKSFIDNCPTCEVYKDAHHLPFGLVQISDTPCKPWDTDSVDFLSDLPLSDCYTAIIIIVDNFSKMIHLIPHKRLPSAEDTVNAFMTHVFKLHGVPSTIVSDRGSQFTSAFWKRFLNILGIDYRFSTAHHHSSNSQVERIIGTVIQVLRCLVDNDPSLWSYYLPLVEFAINNSFNVSTNATPFEIVYGYNPAFCPTIPFTKARNNAEFTTLDWYIT